MIVFYQIYIFNKRKNLLEHTESLKDRYYNTHTINHIRKVVINKHPQESFNYFISIKPT